MIIYHLIAGFSFNLIAGLMNCPITRQTGRKMHHSEPESLKNLLGTGHCPVCSPSLLATPSRSHPPWLLGRLDTHAHSALDQGYSDGFYEVSLVV